MAYVNHYEDKAGNWKKVKVVASPKTFYEGECADSCTRFVFLTFPTRVAETEVRRAASELFYTYCTHSYDCCGNWYCRPSFGGMRKIRARTWMIPLVWSQNV